jgi:hypothetical protein
MMMGLTQRCIPSLGVPNHRDAARLVLKESVKLEYTNICGITSTTSSDAALARH